MAARLTTYLVVGIVAGTLIAGLIVGAQRDDNDGPVDLIVHNAVVYTGTESRTAEAVAVRANQILKVGSTREILRLKRPQTVVIDAKGGSVLPGFNDAHLHLVEGGLALQGVDLSDASTVDEAVERVRAWAHANADARWITGRGWRTFGEEAQPTRQALDAVVADRPVYLVSEDAGSAWVKSRALKLAKIVRRSEDPKNGRIVRDRKGEPTGVLEGSATTLVGTLLPKPAPEDRLRAMSIALAEAQRLGITSVQTIAANQADLEMFDVVGRDDSVGMRLYSILDVGAARTDAEVAKLDAVLEQFADDPVMKSGAATVALDRIDTDGLNRLARLLDARGWQLSIEADTIEDTEEVRAAFGHAVRSNTKAVRERRHRLEHQNGIFTEIGRNRAIGSDWPHGPLSPMRVLQTAVAHFALKDALRAYTYGGAFASYDEQRKGTLEPGMLADIVVLSDNLFDLEPARFDRVTVAYTIFAGRIVYPAERRTTTFP